MTICPACITRLRPSLHLKVCVTKHKHAFPELPVNCFEDEASGLDLFEVLVWLILKSPCTLNVICLLLLLLHV